MSSKIRSLEEGPKTRILKWRGSESLKGCRSRLQAAVNACLEGAEITLDLKSARNLLEICDQAIHTEEGHGT